MENVLQNRLRLGYVIAVRYAKNHVHTADVLRRDVLDHITPDLTVRHHEQLVVKRQQAGGDQAHFVHLAEDAAHFDHIIRIIRAIE